MQSTEKELESLSVERLKHGASVYRYVTRFMGVVMCRVDGVGG